jgi:uncharacterized protein (DUF2164 family)
MHVAFYPQYVHIQEFLIQQVLGRMFLISNIVKKEISISTKVNDIIEKVFILEKMVENHVKLIKRRCK